MDLYIFLFAVVGCFELIIIIANIFSILKSEDPAVQQIFLKAAQDKLVGELAEVQVAAMKAALKVGELDAQVASSKKEAEAAKKLLGEVEQSRAIAHKEHCAATRRLQEVIRRKAVVEKKIKALDANA